MLYTIMTTKPLLTSKFLCRCKLTLTFFLQLFCSWSTPVFSGLTAREHAKLLFIIMCLVQQYNKRVSDASDFFQENIWLRMFLLLLSETQSFNLITSQCLVQFLVLQSKSQPQKDGKHLTSPANSFFCTRKSIFFFSICFFFVRGSCMGHWPVLFPHPRSPLWLKKNVSVSQNVEVDMTICYVPRV